MVRNAHTLSCYECNSLLSVGCENPINSGSYFYNFCGNDFQFCVVNYIFNVFKFQVLNFSKFDKFLILIATNNYN